jgi:hypothetical protein
MQVVITSLMVSTISELPKIFLYLDDSQPTDRWAEAWVICVGLLFELGVHI